MSTITSMAGMEVFGWLMCAFALSALIREPGARAIARHPVMLLAYALAIWAGVGLWWNDVAKPWQGLAEMRWIFSMLGIAVMCATTIQEKMLEKVMLALTIVATLVALYAITQYWTGYDLLRGARSPLLLVEESRGTDTLRYRPYGLFKMTLTYACSYAMFGLVPFCLAFYYKDRKRFWLLQSAAAVIFTSVFLTFSRGVWISLSVALLLILWFLWRRALIWLPALGLALLAVAYSVSPVLRARVASFSEAKHQSNSDRRDLWRANFYMFEKNPVFGVGFEQNGPPVVDKYYEELGITTPFKSHAHNNYLNFLSGTGLPGFALYLAFIFGALWVTWRNLARLSKKSPLYYLVFASLGAQIVLHVGGLTEYNFGDAEVQYQYLAYVALNVALAVRR